MRTSHVAPYLVMFFVLGSAGSGFGEGVVPPHPAGEETDAAGRVVRTRDGERVVLSQYESAEASVEEDAASPAVEQGAARSGVALAAVEPPALAFQQVFDYSIWGASIGRTGLLPVDLDGDGRLEIVLGASVVGTFAGNSVWRVVRYDETAGEYEIVWSSPTFDANVAEIAVFPIGGRQKVFVGLTHGRLLVYDGPSLALEREVPVSTRSLQTILLADADNDGAQELVVVTDAAIHLLDPSSLEEQSRVARGATDAAVGNVDADARLEIVLVNGAVLEYDGAVAAEEWNFGSFGAGAYLALSDLDGDGMQEIVSARSWHYIDVYDADRKTPKYQIVTELDIHALLLADVTGDGRAEILYGDAQWGEIHALDAAAGQPLWQISNPEHGTTRIAVADVDADGQLEVLWGAGWTSSGADYLYVHGLPSRAREWQSFDLGGPFAAVALGDADDDGAEELVAISWTSNSGYADGVVHVFDAQSFDLEWRSDPRALEGSAWTGIHDVAVGDVDGDGGTEIVVGTDRYYTGAIYVLDGGTHVIERRILLDGGSPIHALALGDVDGDGKVEIVAGGGYAHSGSPGTYLYSIDGATGVVEYQSVALGSGNVFALELADLDGDGIPEAVGALDQIFVVDVAQRTLRKSVRTGLRGLDLADPDGDGRVGIWAGSSAGELLEFDPVSLDARVVAPLCAGPVHSVRLERASSLAGSVQFACENELGIYGIFEDSILWRASGLATLTGSANNLQVADRGEQALLIAGNRAGVRGYLGWGTANRDVDEDGVLNHRDNCAELANPEQADADGDGVGDACNDAFDADGDEWANGRDNCPALANAGQSDADGNGVGDACNEGEDADADEWADALDNCATASNPDQADRDGDAEGDACDAYPDDPDNYAARCEEAILNEMLLSEALNLCESRPRFEDADGDGEADATDACADSPASVPVDSAGCTHAQFCASFSGQGVIGMSTCAASDWNNDEPLWRAEDCRGQFPRRFSWPISFACVAR